MRRKIVHLSGCAILFSIIVLILSVVIADGNDELANSYVTSMRFWFYEAMGWSSLLLIPGVFCAGGYYRLKWTDLWVLLFIIWSVVWAPEKNVQTQALLLLGLCYYNFRVLLSASCPANRWLMFAWMILGIVEVILGTGQLYGWYDSNHSLYKLTGTFFNPGPYAGFLVVVLPVALYWMLRTGKVSQRLFVEQWRLRVLSWPVAEKCIGGGVAALCVFLIFSILPASMSRGSWLAGAAGCAVVLWRHYRLKRRLLCFWRERRRGAWLVILISGILLIGGGWAMYHLKKGSADGRMLMWRTSAQAAQEASWTGVGLGHFGAAYGRAQADYFAKGKAAEWEERVAGAPEYGFNEYLQIAVEQGWVGLLLFGLMVSSALWQASGSKVKGSSGVMGGLTAFLVFCLVSYPLRVLPLCLIFVLLLAMAVQEKRGDYRLKHGKPYERWMFYVLPFILSGLVWTIIRNRQEEREAYVRWEEERKYYRMDIYEETVDHYRELYPYLKDQAAFLFEYGRCLAQTKQYEKSNRIMQEGLRWSSDPMFYNVIGKNEQALKRYDRAEEAFLEAEHRVPNRIYPYYLRAKMYFESGQIEKGRLLARQVIAKEPKVPSMAIEEMKEELKELLKDPDKQMIR